VEPIKNRWHALAPGLGVRGDSEDDARERFREAVAKDAELRARTAARR
jgi:hypothetical protein